MSAKHVIEVRRKHYRKSLKNNRVVEKAAEDDLFNECIDKFSSASKENKDISVLTKDNAKEASIELISKKDNIDYMDAEAKVKKSKFDKIWDEHDNMNKGFIDTTEAYGLMQDMASSDE